MGEVGQESNLQPAVLEDKARCPESSEVVQTALQSAFFGDVSSRFVQERPTSM
jgi:hypothetical protein